MTPYITASASITGNADFQVRPQINIHLNQGWYLGGFEFEKDNFFQSFSAVLYNPRVFKMIGKGGFENE